MEAGANVKKFYLNQIKEILEKKNIPLDVTENKKSSSSKKEKPQNKVTSNKLHVQKKRDVEVVVFKQQHGAKRSHSGIQKPSSSSDKIKDANLLKAKELLKQIEFDVTSYGMKGFSLEEKRKLEQERAIRLGAQPRKPKYVNYKILMEENKKQREESSSKITRKKKKKNTVFWQESNSLHTKQMGRFKDGVLELSDKDIKGL